MKKETIVIGAGAAGLVAALELAKAGWTVTVVEAGDRIGGRIMPLDAEAFGFPAQGGAEFVHGNAPITKGLIGEAGLTFFPEDGEAWSTVTGKLQVWNHFFEDGTLLKQKLGELTDDMTVEEFLQRRFPGKEHEGYRDTISRLAEGFDAADVRYLSAMALREEWFGEAKESDGKIREGYGALLDYLGGQCQKMGVRFIFQSAVRSVISKAKGVAVTLADGTAREVATVVVTVSIPALKDVDFGPGYEWKHELASQVAFGNVVKIVFRFKQSWWDANIMPHMGKMRFILSNEKFSTWWTQYPEQHPSFVAWMAGPEAHVYESQASDELVSLAVSSLSNILGLESAEVARGIEKAEAVNWAAVAHVGGAYSYMTPGTREMREKLREPIEDRIFFAGEVFSSQAATVEGAFESGIRAARELIDSDTKRNPSRE